MRDPMPARRKWPIVLGGILAVLVIAIGIGLFVLDGILTSKAHEQAAKLSKDLGRPVKIGSVATKIVEEPTTVISEKTVITGKAPK